MHYFNLSLILLISSLESRNADLSRYEAPTSKTVPVCNQNDDCRVKASVQRRDADNRQGSAMERTKTSMLRVQTPLVLFRWMTSVIIDTVETVMALGWNTNYLLKMPEIIVENMRTSFLFVCTDIHLSFAS